MRRNANPGDVVGSNLTWPTLLRIVDPARIGVRLKGKKLMALLLQARRPVRLALPGTSTMVGHGKIRRITPQVEKRPIGAHDARMRADSMVLPAWTDLSAAPGYDPLPVNHRPEAWGELRERVALATTSDTR